MTNLGTWRQGTITISWENII